MRLTQSNNRNSFLIKIAEATLPVRMKAEIPMDAGVEAISKALKSNDSTVQVYAVGGAVRDYLFSHFNGQGAGKKDIDLTTNLSEEEIISRLQRAGIAVTEKESSKREDGKESKDKKPVVNTFGVVFATVDGVQYEIAPFRKDIGSVDGRRPERVERASIEEDAQRRDLTMNNLYYDFDKKEILDFNPNGQGIEDIKNGVARPVGDPHERFSEDKLRVLRIIRFFSRFNDGSALDHLDERTLAAIEHFKDLKSFGLTEERIAGEFAQGLNQAKDIAAYIKNYVDLGLLDSVFSGLNVDVSGAGKLNGLERKNGKLNIKVALAWLLRNNSDVVGKLLKLKYSRTDAESVQFLIDCLKLSSDSSFSMVKRREKISSLRGDLIEFANLVGGSDGEKLKHFAGYEMVVPSGSELMGKGLKGIAIGQEQQKVGADHYKSSINEHMLSLPGKEENSNVLAGWVMQNCRFAMPLPKADSRPIEDEKDRTGDEEARSMISSSISEEIQAQIEAKFPNLEEFDNGFNGVVYRNKDKPGWLLKVTTDDSEKIAAEVQMERKLSCIVPVISCQELSTDKGDRTC